MLHAYTIAYIYTSSAGAQKVCDDGGILAAGTSGGAYSFTVSLHSPATLGWQKNAAGGFRQTVAQRMHMPADDVQALIILQIPAGVIKNTGRPNADTFTVKERPEALKLMLPVQGGGAIYSGSHIIKMYGLEPATLVNARKELAKLIAGAGGREEQAALRLTIKQLIRDADTASGQPL